MARPKSIDEFPLPETLAAPFEHFLNAMTDTGLSANTLDAYRRDLGRYLRHLSAQGVDRLQAAEQQHVAHLLRTHARGEICAARLGGEEFALLAGTETLDPAIALQLLGEIAAADMPHQTSRRTNTIDGEWILKTPENPRMAARTRRSSQHLARRFALPSVGYRDSVSALRISS